MISLPPSVRIFLATKRTDMRKGHDGLAALVQQQMGQDVFTGHLFVFVSRGGNRIKILTWALVQAPGARPLSVAERDGG